MNKTRKPLEVDVRVECGIHCTVHANRPTATQAERRQMIRAATDWMRRFGCTFFEVRDVPNDEPWGGDFLTIRELARNRIAPCQMWVIYGYKRTGFGPDADRELVQSVEVYL